MPYLECPATREYQAGGFWLVLAGWVGVSADLWAERLKTGIRRSDNHKILNLKHSADSGPPVLCPPAFLVAIAMNRGGDNRRGLNG